jgi:hypothetical protein
MTDFFVTCLPLWCFVLLIVVLEGREKTMCDSRFWLLRELGAEAPATARAVEFRGALLVGIVGLNDGFFVTCLLLWCIVLLIAVLEGCRSPPCPCPSMLHVNSAFSR